MLGAVAFMAIWFAFMLVLCGTVGQRTVRSFLYAALTAGDGVSAWQQVDERVAHLATVGTIDGFLVAGSPSRSAPIETGFFLVVLFDDAHLVVIDIATKGTRIAWFETAGATYEPVRRATDVGFRSIRIEPCGVTVRAMKRTVRSICEALERHGVEPAASRSS